MDTEKGRGTPDPEGFAREIDRTVGAALRARREELRLSQSDVAAVLGVTRQQVDKYEDGRDRIGAGQLAAAARHLGRGVAWFFDPDSGAPRLSSFCEMLPLETLVPSTAGDGLTARVSFKYDAAAPWPHLSIDVVALIESGRAPMPLPRALYPAMLRHGVAALRAIAASAGDPSRSDDVGPRDGVALN